MSNDVGLSGFNPCPLCGRKDDMWTDSEASYKRGLENHNITTIFVTCNFCSLTLRNEQKDQGFYERRNALRKQWNRLAAVPESPEKEQTENEAI
jgi:phage terminase large subunit GpA-like protein